MKPIMQPRVHLYTRDEYYRLGDTGLFDDNHVELIEGSVFERGPKGSHRCTAVTLTRRVLGDSVGEGYFVQSHSPLDLGNLSEPEPDVAVIAGKVRDYTKAHPTDAALIVEVADLSLHYCHNEKASLYAKAGIPEYWIINLVDRTLEVLRKPGPDSARLYGFGYRDVSSLTSQDSVSPLAMPRVKIAVADLLP